MDDDTIGILVVVGIVALVVGGTTVFAFTYPQYNVWKNELRGEATLKEAQWDRQVKVEEARANLQSEKLNAQSEVERAKGVAEANEIIGESLKNNEAYLRYLWVKGLTDGTSEVIYVPTEANLPILEAGRMIGE